MKRVLLVVAGVVALVALVLWGALRQPDNDRATRVATSYSSGEQGAKALYLLLEQSGFTVTRLRRLELPASSGDDDTADADADADDRNRLALWILSPAPLPAGDRQTVLAFVKAGGTVVAPPEPIADLLRRAGVSGARVEKATCAASPCPLATPWGLKKLTAPAESLQKLAGAEPAEVYALSGQQPIVARYPIDGGGGGLVSLGAFDRLRNHAIGGGDDAGPFWVRLAGALGRRHAFDELHTGYGDLNLVTLLWRAPYRWAVVDLGLMLVVAVWMLGSRVRPAERDPLLRRRETRDHVQAVADWWGRSGDAGLPLHALLVSLDARAAGRLRAPDGRNFLAWVATVRPELAARVAEAWRRAETMVDARRPSPREIVTVASELRNLEMEVFPC